MVRNVVVSTPLDSESFSLHKFGILTVGYNGYTTSINWDPSYQKEVN